MSRNTQNHGPLSACEIILSFLKLIPKSSLINLFYSFGCKACTQAAICISSFQDILIIRYIYIYIYIYNEIPIYYALDICFLSSMMKIDTCYTFNISVFPYLCGNQLKCRNIFRRDSLKVHLQQRSIGRGFFFFWSLVL